MLASDTKLNLIKLPKLQKYTKKIELAIIEPRNMHKEFM